MQVFGLNVQLLRRWLSLIDSMIILSRHLCVDTILLDRSKAFDSFDHHLVTFKLKNIAGITGLALAWLKNYLATRTQLVNLDKISSSLTNVPQGSTIRP